MKATPRQHALRFIAPTFFMLSVATLVACNREPAPSHEATQPESTTATDGSAPLPSPSGAMTPAGPATVEPPRPQVKEGIPTRIELPPPTTETPPVALGAAIEYGCESGATLRVSYGKAIAEVAWTGGSQLRLQAKPADAEGGELYAGDGYQLRRLGSTVQLRQSGAGSEWRCMEANASA